LRKCSPDPSYAPVDKLLLACIRRMNLDSFWSRASKTINVHRRKLEQGTGTPEGPMPASDHCGYEAATQMLLNSRKPGRHSKDCCCQWDAIRKIRTAYANHVRASPQIQVPHTLSGRSRWEASTSVDRPVQCVLVSLFLGRLIDGKADRLAKIGDQIRH
jgi:hypothetical protein